MKPLLLAGALLLTACGHVTPGLTLSCTPGCHLTPANLHTDHAPGERDAFLPDPFGRP